MTTTTSRAPGSTYRLGTPAQLGPTTRVALDERQQAVVDHAGGPLLVLAGPGRPPPWSRPSSGGSRTAPTRAGCWR